MRCGQASPAATPLFGRARCVQRTPEGDATDEMCDAIAYCGHACIQKSRSERVVVGRAVGLRRCACMILTEAVTRPVG